MKSGAICQSPWEDVAIILKEIVRLDNKKPGALGIRASCISSRLPKRMRACRQRLGTFERG